MRERVGILLTLLSAAVTLAAPIVPFITAYIDKRWEGVVALALLSAFAWLIHWLPERRPALWNPVALLMLAVNLLLVLVLIGPLTALVSLGFSAVLRVLIHLLYWCDPSLVDHPERMGVGWYGRE